MILTLWLRILTKKWSRGMGHTVWHPLQNELCCTLKNFYISCNFVIFQNCCQKPNCDPDSKNVNTKFACSKKFSITSKKQGKSDSRTMRLVPRRNLCFNTSNSRNVFWTRMYELNTIIIYLILILDGTHKTGRVLWISGPIFKHQLNCYDLNRKYNNYIFWDHELRDKN